MSVEQVEFNIPSSPEDRNKLKAGVKSLTDSLARIEGENEYIKETVKALSEDFDIPGKYIKRMAKEMYKGDFDKKASEEDQYQTLYETIANLQTGTSED